MFLTDDEVVVGAGLGSFVGSGVLDGYCCVGGGAKGFAGAMEYVYDGWFC